jgi:hypothetical protein
MHGTVNTRSTVVGWHAISIIEDFILKFVDNTIIVIDGWRYIR